MATLPVELLPVVVVPIGGVQPEYNEAEEQGHYIRINSCNMILHIKNGNVSADFDMVWDTDDAGFAVIMNAFFNDTVLGMKILDGENGQGLLGDFRVVRFTRSEPPTEVINVSVTVEQAYSNTSPSWVSGN